MQACRRDTVWALPDVERLSRQRQVGGNCNADDVRGDFAQRPVRNLHQELTGPLRRVPALRHRQVRVAEAYARLDRFFYDAPRQAEDGRDHQARAGGGFECSATLSASTRTVAATTYRLFEPNFAEPEEGTL